MRSACRFIIFFHPSVENSDEKINKYYGFRVLAASVVEDDRRPCLWKKNCNYSHASFQCKKRRGKRTRLTTNSWHFLCYLRTTLDFGSFFSVFTLCKMSASTLESHLIERLQFRFCQFHTLDRGSLDIVGVAFVWVRTCYGAKKVVTLFMGPKIFFSFLFTRFELFLSFDGPYQLGD